ncbi:MAG: hypothetical protein V7K27_29565 [Nostoc sp.]|uniref:hypothetical protein n=1 Tax=Nostoc sp. TaxID=1180 RepID=UPI002FFD3975
MKIQSLFLKLLPTLLILNTLALSYSPISANTTQNKAKFQPVSQKQASTINTISAKIFIQDIKNNPIKNAQVILIGKNNTYLESLTHNNGIAEFNIKSKQNYTLLVAHPNFAGIIVRNFSPKKDSQKKLEHRGNVGSVIFPDSTGYIKGLKGRLAPILDTSHRTYIYADNIAVNGGQQQPVNFEIGKPLNLEDSEGSTMQITIRFAQGNTFLIEFLKPS